VLVLGGEPGQPPVWRAGRHGGAPALGHLTEPLLPHRDVAGTTPAGTDHLAEHLRAVRGWQVPAAEVAPQRPRGDPRDPRDLTDGQPRVEPEPGQVRGELRRRLGQDDGGLVRGTPAHGDILLGRTDTPAYAPRTGLYGFAV